MPFPFDDILFLSGNICDQVAKFGPNFDVFGPPNFWRRGPKFLTQFFKFWSPSNIRQNLMTIDRSTSEIIYRS